MRRLATIVLKNGSRKLRFSRCSESTILWVSSSVCRRDTDEKRRTEPSCVQMNETVVVSQDSYGDEETGNSRANVPGPRCTRSAAWRPAPRTACCARRGRRRT